MNRPNPSRESIKRFAARSTTASAKLERRVVPSAYVRPAKVEAFIEQRQHRGFDTG